jgi:hypothetical protein
VGEIRIPEPVKLICGIIAAGESMVAAARDALRDAYGEIDLESGILPFNFTAYYRDEMGAGLLRKFVSFDERVDPGLLPKIKRHTNELERALSGIPEGTTGRRRVNLDPGYVTPSNLVLATTKNYTHRVYLGGGIYGEVTLAFAKIGCRHFEWTYPDYRTEAYGAFFLAVRRRLMETRKRDGMGEGGTG